MSEAVYEELMESGLAVTRCQTRGRGILQNVGAGGATYPLQKVACGAFWVVSHQLKMGLTP
jgi:hypothetical protein